MGGKYQTNRTHGINAEYGAIRFEWGCHPHLEHLIRELNCKLTTFPAFCGNKGPELNFIRRVCDLLWSLNAGQQLATQDVTQDAMDKVDTTRWVPYRGGRVFPHELYINEFLRDYERRLFEEMESMLDSIRAFFIKDDTLVLWLLRWTKVLVCNTSIKTCANGNDSIVEALAAAIPDVHCGHELMSISTIFESQYDGEMDHLCKFCVGDQSVGRKVFLCTHLKL